MSRLSYKSLAAGTACTAAVTVNSATCTSGDTAQTFTLTPQS